MTRRQHLSRPLLAAKLAPPPAPAPLLHRPRLLDRLDAGVPREVTLIRGGPGWGKTSLTATWTRSGRAPGPVAWLALDQHDDRPDRFWSYVLAALRETGAVPPGNALHDLDADRVDEEFLRRVADGIAALPHPVVLVLDDLHEVTDPRVLASLAFLLRHPVRQLRLVVTTRASRTAPLHRIRIREGLLEIGAAELNFDLSETTDLLAARGVHLTPAEATALLDRSEGWAAGLTLATGLMLERGVPAGLDAFTGDQGPVAEYLSAEVLAAVPLPLQRFLRVTSVVDQVCGELADFLTGETHGERNLRELAGCSTLVTALDPGSGWFRYHRLLAELLRCQLSVEAPEAAQELHSRAALWFAQHDSGLTAVRHAVAARDWPLAGRLALTTTGPRIGSAGRRPLIDLLTRIPSDQLSATGELELCSALLADDRQDHEAAAGAVDRARALLASGDDRRRRLGEIMVRSFDAALARERGDTTALTEAAEDELRLLDRVAPGELPAARQYRAAALSDAGAGLFWTGRRGQAEARLRAGMAVARSVDAEPALLHALSHLALLQAEQGNLHDARQHAGAGLELARDRGWHTAPQSVATYVALGRISLERNRLEAAGEAVRAGLNAQRAAPEPVQRAALGLTQVRLLLAQGEVDTARLVTERVVEQTGAAPMPAVLAQWLVIAEAELELSAGRPDEVLKRIGDSPDGMRAAPRVLVRAARAHLLLGAPRDAEEVLAPLRHSAPDLGSAVEVWLVTALVEDAARRDSRAIDALARAVTLAAPQDMRQPFIGVDPTRVTSLLERCPWLTPERSSFVAALLAEVASAHAGTAAEPVGEELTDRERDVLRYLPTLLRNDDIADRMYVSVNTVKAHLRSLYRKLGVTHRRDAVDRARQSGLL